MADGENGDDILYVEDPISVAKVRLWGMVVGILCHGLRLGALAPLMIAFMISALLGMTITDTHDEWLPRIIEPLPESMQITMQETLDDESLGWDDIGKRMAAPLLMIWFGISFVISIIEGLTGWHLYKYAPKLWHWLVLFLIIFTSMTILTVTNISDTSSKDAPFGIIIAVVSGLNLFLAVMASFSAVALKTVNMAEEGTMESIRKYYGLVVVPQKSKA